LNNTGGCSLFLNQLLEEYRESEEKDDVFNVFVGALWKSTYKFKKYKKYYSYRLYDELLGKNDELILLFKLHSNVEYTISKSFYKKRLDPIDYIKIHINNMYGFLFDEDVYYRSEYYKLLLTPKREYFKTINLIKMGEVVDYLETKDRINKSIVDAERVKEECILKKHSMKFSEYKKLINLYLRRIFDNYIPVHEYEDKHGWEMRIEKDGWSEDNYIIKYFSRSLTGYLRNYIRDNKVKEIKEKYCQICGIEISNTCNNKKYCAPCSKIIQQGQKNKWKREKWNKEEK
jgi:hypothetical protein